MRIIKLGDISLLASNVAGSTYDAYDDEDTYGIGDKVAVSYDSDGTTPRFPVIEYESLADANTGNYPPDDPENWIEIGAENRCKMFDAYTNTQTELDADDIEVSIGANGFDSVGLVGIYGTHVTLRLVHDAVTKKEETFDLRTFIAESGWYNWLYGSYEYGISQIIWGFPKYAADAVLEIEITQRSAAAACGMVAIGNQKTLGITRYGAKIGIDDYSIKDTDFLGRTYLNQGDYADRGDIEMWLQNTKIDYVKRQLTAVRGTPCIFDLNNPGVGYQALTIYGFPQNFDIIIPGPIRSKCNLEIKGLI
jgi:hypothetical protein